MHSTFLIFCLVLLAQVLLKFLTVFCSADVLDLEKNDQAARKMGM